MADWVLRGGRLAGGETVDIVVAGERIAEIGPQTMAQGERELALDGRLVLPGFVDAHMHLDRVYALEDGAPAAESLGEAIAGFFAWRAGLTPERMLSNARRAAERALLRGTVALRTHVTVDSTAGLSQLELLLRLRDEMAGRLTIQVVAFPHSPEVDDGRALPLLRQAHAAGAAAIGGAPATSANPRRCVDRLMDLADELGADLDLHVDESDDPAQNSLECLAERKLATGFAGEIVAGHCCALSALNESAAQRVIEKVARAGIQVITLPSCNLYLMGRSDRGRVRRGLTRVHELLAAGVRVAFASDNIRDPFNPFGDADMLQGALITAHALQMGSPAQLRRVLEMGTRAPARMMRLPDYGLEAGCLASFVVLDAPDVSSAIAGVAPRRYVFSQGRLVAQTTVEAELLP